MNNTATTSPKIVIAGGGTGGHVFPALAIKQAIMRKCANVRVIFIGTRQGLEAAVIPREGEELKTFWISGFSRQHLLRNALLPIKLGVSLVQSLVFLARFRPHVVIGTGGYVMGPVLWVAQRMGVPTLLQEQNSFPGYTTRKLAPRASVVCAGFDDIAERLLNARVEITGNPLRASFTRTDRDAARRRWLLDTSRKTVLVFGGSAGARSINEAVAGALSNLLESFNVIWQTGRLGVPSGLDRALIAAAASAQHLIVRDFIEDMAGAYAVADLAVCRAGAMTLAELAMTGLPAVLIPYPFAADDHQTANANAVVKCEAAVLIPDCELSAGKIETVIKSCLQSDSNLMRMASNMKTLARPDAADRIAEIALSLVEQS